MICKDDRGRNIEHGWTWPRSLVHSWLTELNGFFNKKSSNLEDFLLKKGDLAMVSLVLWWTQHNQFMDEFFRDNFLKTTVDFMGTSMVSRDDKRPSTYWTMGSFARKRNGDWRLVTYSRIEEFKRDISWPVWGCNYQIMGIFWTKNGSCTMMIHFNCDGYGSDEDAEDSEEVSPGKRHRTASSLNKCNDIQYMFFVVLCIYIYIYTHTHTYMVYFFCGLDPIFFPVALQICVGQVQVFRGIAIR